MRVRSIIAILLLSSVQLSALLAQEEPCDLASEAELCCPSTWVRADLLYWQPHLRSVDYASTEDGSSLAIGAGRTHRVEFDRDPGFRVALGHMTDMGWGIGVEYTYFSSSTGVASVERPGGVGQLFSTLSHPGGPEEADIATATTTLDYATYDLTAATRIVDREFQSFDIFGGLRWATIENELNAFFDGRDFVNGTIEDRMDINAFGVAFGAEGHWRLRSGWFIFGRSSFAALYGNIRNTRTETNLNGAEQLVDFEDEYVDPLFNFETRIGLAKSIGKCEVRAGYDLNIWTGIGDRVRFTDDIEETAYAAASGDLLLEGFFVQLAYSW